MRYSSNYHSLRLLLESAMLTADHAFTGSLLQRK
jgi:hypothetical protein